MAVVITFNAGEYDLLNRNKINTIPHSSKSGIITLYNSLTD